MGEELEKILTSNLFFNKLDKLINTITIYLIPHTLYHSA